MIENPFKMMLDKLESIEAKLDKLLSEKEKRKADVVQDEFFTVDEAAKFLRLKKQTIYTHISKSLIPHMKRGKRVMFLKKDLEEWLKKGRKKTIDEIKKSI